jgi:hypothetical protein
MARRARAAAAANGFTNERERSHSERSSRRAGGDKPRSERERERVRSALRTRGPGGDKAAVDTNARRAGEACGRVRGAHD